MSRRTAGPACRECGQPILWWRSASREGGWIRVDPSPDDNGTIRRRPGPRRAGRPTLYGEALSGHELAAAEANGELLFTRHSSTCPARRETSGRRPAGLEIGGQS